MSISLHRSEAVALTHSAVDTDTLHITTLNPKPRHYNYSIKDLHYLEGYLLDHFMASPVTQSLRSLAFMAPLCIAFAVWRHAEDVPLHGAPRVQGAGAV